MIYFSYVFLIFTIKKHLLIAKYFLITDKSKKGLKHNYFFEIWSLNHD